MSEESEKYCERVLALLPFSVGIKLRAVFKSRKDYPRGLSEIRIRVGRVCSAVLSGENVTVGRGITEAEAKLLLDKLLGKSLYAHIHTLTDGYLTLDGGIRVGVIFRARYEGGVAEISEPHGFVFRLPTAESEVAGRIFECWRSVRCERRGMLIFAGPSGGKTAALRSLARNIALEQNQRVVIVDERCEFREEDYQGACVDILKGYKKHEGIELALRCLSPQILIIDEISASDIESLLSVGRGGVGLIASIHASSYSELIGKAGVRALCDASIVENAAGISRSGTEFSVEFYSLKDAEAVCL